MTPPPSSSPSQPPSRPLRIGVVGVQGIGMAHLFALAGNPDVTTTAVCDVDEAAATKTAQDFGAAGFTDAEALFTSGEVDAVILAVPPTLHAPMTLAALEAGLHVYLEKPMTTVAADGAELIAAAQASDRVVAVGYQHRFQPSYERARQLLDDGEVGTVFRRTMVSTRWFRPHHYFDAKPWRGRWDAVGGGVLVTQATHTLDAFVWLGGMPSRVTAEAWRSLHRSDVEGEVSAILSYPDGARGTLLASTVDPVGRNRIELHGSRGTIVADGHALELTRLDAPVEQLLSSEDDFAEVPSTTQTLVEEPENSQLEVFSLIQASHADFVRAITTGSTPRNTPEQANGAIELANAIYLSAVTAAPVDLPLDHDAYREVYEGLCAGRLSVPRVEAPVGSAT